MGRPGTRRAPAPSRVHLDVFEGPFDLLLGADRQAQARHHRGLALQGHRRVHRLHQAALRRLGPGPGPATSSSSRRRCSTSRPRGCCRRARSRTRRTWRCSRPATCCSRGCCSTAPTRRSPPCSPGGWRPRPGGSRAGYRSSRGSPSCSPRCCSPSARRSSPRSPRGRSAPKVTAGRRRSSTSTHPFVSIREQAVLIAGRLRGLVRASVPASCPRARRQLRDRRLVPRAA